MRAIVVGGLASGVALTRAGWDVAILERSVDPAEVGAGISLWANALRALDHLGVWPDVQAAASLSAGGVVAADGLRSQVRRRLWPQHAAARYAGFTAWRGVTTEAFDLPDAGETWGRGSEFGMIPMRDGRVYWFATANRPEGDRAPDEHVEVAGRFGDWHDPIPQVIDATSSDAVLRHDIYSLPVPLPRFTRGRVALLGDAAHAMTPNLGQGACQALEDAVTLAELVRHGDVPSALEAYDAIRRPRTERFVKTSARAARVTQAESRVGTAVRNFAARVVAPKLAGRAVQRMVDWSPPGA